MNVLNTRFKTRLYFLVGMIFVSLIALATPHIIHGHFIIPRPYAQSTILFIDLIIAYIFYYFYQKKLKKLNQVENELVSAYEYIGLINNKMQLINDFINNLPVNDIENKSQKKWFFENLLKKIIVSVTKAKLGLLRFVDRENNKTISEFYYHQNNQPNDLKLSNKEIIKSHDGISKDGLTILRSDFPKTKITCILCYQDNNQLIDFKLLKSLLNQIHLLFLIINVKQSIKL